MTALRCSANIDRLAGGISFDRGILSSSMLRIGESLSEPDFGVMLIGNLPAEG